MTFAVSLRRAAVLTVLALTAALAGCAEPAPPMIAPPPPPPPAVSLSPRVIEQASAYRAYIARTAVITPAFVDGDSVAQSLKTGMAYEPGQLLRGAIAYGAVVALQDPAFVAGVRKYAGDAEQRRTVAYEIMKDPAYAVGFSGSASAAGLVMTALGDDGKRLLDLGRSVKQAAYDVQHSPWSKAEVPGREGRLALAKQLSATPLMGETAETARLQLAVTGSTPMGLSAPAASPPYTPLVIRSLAVAALAALGYADETSIAQVTPILADPRASNCLNMSKLNLYQCLAVSKPHYEDVFCLGQHVLMDTGSCLMQGAGVPGSPADVKLANIPEAQLVPVPPKAKKRAKKR
ncbi:MAG: hypothetical protein JWQ29_2287 [Phenylobacterium sp.]|nr:hypothetical protein [Phenylobacterium sp.]